MAAQLVITKERKQPKYPSTKSWLKPCITPPKNEMQWSFKKTSKLFVQQCGHNPKMWHEWKKKTETDIAYSLLLCKFKEIIYSYLLPFCHLYTISMYSICVRTYLHEFPRAAITKCHKLGDFKQQNFILIVLRPNTIKLSTGPWFLWRIGPSEEEPPGKGLFQASLLVIVPWLVAA